MNSLLPLHWIMTNGIKIWQTRSALSWGNGCLCYIVWIYLIQKYTQSYFLTCIKVYQKDQEIIIHRQRCNNKKCGKFNNNFQVACCVVIENKITAWKSVYRFIIISYSEWCLKITRHKYTSNVYKTTQDMHVKFPVLGEMVYSTVIFLSLLTIIHHPQYLVQI